MSQEHGSKADIREYRHILKEMYTNACASGCACDIPSVTYQYNWDPQIWSSFYAEAPEILAYFKGVVERHDLSKYIKLRHQVKHAEWLTDSGKWRVTIVRLDDGVETIEECDVFINAMGFLKSVQPPEMRIGSNIFSAIGNGRRSTVSRTSRVPLPILRTIHKISI